MMWIRSIWTNDVMHGLLAYISGCFALQTIFLNDWRELILEFPLYLSNSEKLLCNGFISLRYWRIRLIAHHVNSVFGS